MTPTTETPKTLRKRGRTAKAPVALSSIPVSESESIADTSTASTPVPQKPVFKPRRPGLPPRRTIASYPITPASIELLNGLNNFCGVGTIDIPMLRRAAVGMEAPDGWLWLETPRPEFKFPKFTIEANLIELVNCGWLRCTYRMITDETHQEKPLSVARVRVYVLPDDVGRTYIKRDDPYRRKCLKAVMMAIDDSEDAWKLKTKRIDGISKPKEESMSLFYMFNKLNSPQPNPESFWIKDENTKMLLRDVLSKDRKDLPGMKTELYEYQKKTVAMMLQKELAPEQTQDPRLEDVTGPNGDVYFFDSETTEIYQHPRYFDDIKGGILAEEMGTGKTLMCLAVILITKHQCSYIPEEYVQPPPIRKSVGSLLDMCVAAIWRNALPWNEWSDEMSDSCKKAIQDNHGYYEVPPTLRSRSSRYPYDSAATERIYLGTGTIIVCPQNLVDQWKDEIEKHLEKDSLKVLILAHLKDQIPSVAELLRYDIIIFSRTRFDIEAREGCDQKGRREPGGKPPSCQCPYIGATRTRDCSCFNKYEVYKSPLMSIQWKRLIVDEGHSMASASKSNSVLVAGRLPAERRWIVTGTPTSELVGVMPGMVLDECEEDQKARMNRLLEDRKEVGFNEALHLDRIGKMVCDFLKQEPWTLASWKRYMSKGFIERRPGSTACMKNMFQKLFIRTTPKDIEASVKFPPLYPTLTALEPGPLEKISMNLFIGFLATNMVTSERQDKDYMFHKDNRTSLRQLTDNLLKRAGFYWSGYSILDVQEAVKTSKKYLENKASRCSTKDIILLQNAIAAGEIALANQTWKDISIYHEMVYFLSGFPEQLSHHWSLSSNDNSQKASELFEMGGVQVQNLQKSLNAHVNEQDIIPKLKRLGNVFREARETEILQQKPKDPKIGISESSVSTKSLVKTRVIDQKEVSAVPAIPVTPASKDKSERGENSKTPLKSAMKQTKAAPIPSLPPNSPLAKSRIVGTASAKLTYLLNKIVALHKTEKILVFYEDSDVAFYLTQALEILGIENLAYSTNLSSQRKSSHLSIFQRSEKYRVLLMDLKQAARGLNVTSATFVFFVNPVWQSDIEQQAIKRAHRIGQKSTVHVETLYLVGTIEEAMVKRRQAMTEKERGNAKTLVDDFKMRDIIQSLGFLKVDEGEGMQRANMLKAPEPLFGDGKHGGVYDEIEDVKGESNVTRLPRDSSLNGANGTPGTPPISNISPIAVTSRPARVSSDLHDTTLHGLNANCRAPPASPKRKRTPEVSLTPPSMNPAGNQLSTSTPLHKRKRLGFMGNMNRDWVEESEDEDGETLIAQDTVMNGNGDMERDDKGRKEKKSVRFG